MTETRTANSSLDRESKWISVVLLVATLAIMKMQMARLAPTQTCHPDSHVFHGVRDLPFGF